MQVDSSVYYAAFTGMHLFVHDLCLHRTFMWLYCHIHPPPTHTHTTHTKFQSTNAFSVFQPYSTRGCNKIQRPLQIANVSTTPLHAYQLYSSLLATSHMLTAMQTVDGPTHAIYTVCHTSRSRHGHMCPAVAAAVHATTVQQWLIDGWCEICTCSANTWFSG